MHNSSKIHTSIKNVITAPPWGNEYKALERKKHYTADEALVFVHTLLHPGALQRRPSPCRRQNFRPPLRAALPQPSYWHSSTLALLLSCPGSPSARSKNMYHSYHNLFIYHRYAIESQGHTHQSGGGEEGNVVAQPDHVHHQRGCGAFQQIKKTRLLPPQNSRTNQATAQQ